MRTISKGAEPPNLTAWKKKHPHGVYNDLNKTTVGKSVRATIRDYACREQFHLCAYCCQGIQNIEDCHNEHVEAQKLNPKRTLDFSNIVASCRTRDQCGDAHKSQHLPLTPLMAECETELRFSISGRVAGLSHRAINTIQVLNLGDHEKNNRALIEKRKQLFNALLWKNGINPDDGLEADELLEILLSDLSQPPKGQMEPFTPVVINILQSQLSLLKSF